MAAATETGRVYLDYNATALARPEAREAVAHALALGGNPSSVHGYGRAAREIVETARDQVGSLVGAKPSQIVFTSGGTEAIATVLRGAGRARTITSTVEHVAVLSNAGAGACVEVGPDGLVDPDALDALIGADGSDALVSVMLANNETGAIQPLSEIARRARERGALVHTDAVQAAGKIPLDFQALGVHAMSLSAHKVGGPQGAGALIVDAGIEIEPLMIGGGQESRQRAGTENVPGIAGFGAAAAAAERDLADFAKLAALRDRLEAAIKKTSPRARIFAEAALRLPNTSCIGVPGLASDTLVIALDLAGIAVSAGSACSSGKVTPSHVLMEMGATEEEARAAIRVSMGWATEPGDVDRFLAAWAEATRDRAAA